ncbi:MAG: sugar ABC transporter substrate-binding protein [Christensenella hongkongensis]|uniref:sugar ABC transporter substrate-binding protein n=1 Tax=Christensenella hongkongensis TaxID=270498 RepID=UPI00267239F2|nr:sugar ABC transporter substrate-binding protein [Christensenella hongkongensis]MDY3004400.1 sugar ABC transporter substrate-binding protein [Christensenella hongkongensis]
MKKTKGLALATAIIMAAMVLLSACAAPAAPSEAASTEAASAAASTAAPADNGGGETGGSAKTVGIAIYSMDADSCVALVKEAQAVADELGWKVTLLDAQGDPSTQADQMANLISQKVDAIILNPTDTTSLLPSIQAAKEAGIPVVGVGMEMDKECMDQLLFFAGVDDYSLALTGCEWIAENYKDKGAQVALITGAAGTDPTNKTIQAFQDATKDTDINYAGDFAGDFDSAKAMSITEDLMTKYPELSVIYCQDHVMALGAASAVQDAGKAEQIAIVGACGIPDYLQYVKDGSVTCFGYVLLYQCGGFAMRQLSDYFNDPGAEFAPKYYAAPVVVTAQNVDQADSIEFDFVAAK